MASPARRGTAVAASVTGTDCAPKPNASTPRAATGHTAGACAVIGTRARMPPAVTVEPATARRHGATRRSSGGAAAEPATIPRLSGSSNRPAVTASKRSTSCSHRVLA
ncbi:hypothetical protein GCM10010399_13330 [Dactylosporangium fulvum]